MWKLPLELLSTRPANLLLITGSIWQLLVELFFFYLAYKIIFGFIIPVYHASKQMNRKMQEFQQKMKEQEKANNSQANYQPNNASTIRPKPKDDDYIDFEEIK